MYSVEEFDEAKTRILKYIVYKKRTENEIRTKFKNVYDDNLFEDVIEYLKEAEYIDDNQYIEKSISNYKILKNLSIKELKYKLMAKGIKASILEDYFYENNEELEEFEINSAKNIILKKQKDLDEQEIKSYLMKKGYKLENIDNAYKMLEE